MAGINVVLFVMNMVGATRLPVYLALCALLWFVTLKSGVHATLAGVILALKIPLRETDTSEPPLLALEHAIQPRIAFLIVPVFGFANADVSFSGMSWAVLLEPVTIGAAAGLFFGKQIGVFLMTWEVVT